MKMNILISFPFCLLISVIFLTIQIDSPIQAQTYGSCPIMDIAGFSIDNKTSMEQASVCWYQWLYSIPVDNNPLFDKTGTKCSENQHGPIFFLVGSGDGSSVNRECIISGDKYIFQPLINSECGHAEFPNLSHEELITCAKDFQDQAQAFKATLNGVDLPIIRVVTDIFNYTLPQNNLFNTGQQMTVSAAANGHYIFIPPLDPGVHTLKTSAVNVDELTSLSSNPFMQDNTYTLIVE